MKTIEERAKLASEGYEDDGYSAGLYMGYVTGATDQKAIDDAKWLKIKSSWEKEAQINHNDVANYKQGYHDAIEKALKWLRDKLYNYLWTGEDGSINVTTDLFNDFTKVMEE